MRLLVTGGAGFIGSHFVRHWIAHHPDDAVVVLDALTPAGQIERLPAADPRQLVFVHGDIGDFDLVRKLLQEESITRIVNFAAESSVDASIVDARAFLRTNVCGVHSLLEAARAAWQGSGEMGRCRFHQISTDEVFGESRPGEAARDETAPYMPGSPYAASKAAADHLVSAYARTHGLRCSISYSSNNYGPMQLADKLVPRVIQALMNGDDVSLYGDGLQERCWLHVSDHCRAVELCLGDWFEGQRLFVGSMDSVPNIELVRLLAGVVGQQAARMRFVRDRPGHDRRYLLNNVRFRDATGFRPQVPLEEGLRSTYLWYASQPPDSIWRRAFGC